MAVERLKAAFPEEPPPARSHGKAPAALLAKLEECLERFQRNVFNNDRDIEGGEWVLEQHNVGKRHPSVKVWHSVPSRGKAWRVKCSAETSDGSTPEMVYSQLCVNEQKITWDHDSVSWTRRTRCFSGNQPSDRVDIESYISLPHLAGLVKPRCFYEARLTRWEADGKILSAILCLDENDPWASECGAKEFEALAKPAGLPRGQNQPATGMAFWPTEKGTGFCMVAHTLLGGWLPQSPVNNATGDVLAVIARDCISVVGKMPRKAPAPPVTPPQSFVATELGQVTDLTVGSATEATPVPSSFATSPPAAGRVRRRIRVPGCRTEAEYQWRWTERSLRGPSTVSRTIACS